MTIHGITQQLEASYKEQEKLYRKTASAYTSGYMSALDYTLQLLDKFNQPPQKGGQQ